MDRPRNQALRFTGLSSTANIGQIVIASQINDSASNETLYLDNIYFSKTFSGLSFINRYDLDDKLVRGRLIPPLVEQAIRRQQYSGDAEGRHLLSCCSWYRKQR